MRNHKLLPSQKYLKECFKYDRKTGKLIWRRRPIHHFSEGNYRAIHKWWNSRYAGTEALSAIIGGYCKGTLCGEMTRAHRAIWKLVTGKDPIEVDHIDGDRSNNSWSNLREVTSAENKRNACIHRNNTSGCSGVTWLKGRGRWRVNITHNYAIYRGGSFKNLGDAVAKRKALEREHGFHENHGRKAS